MKWAVAKRAGKRTFFQALQTERELEVNTYQRRKQIF